MSESLPNPEADSSAFHSIVAEFESDVSPMTIAIAHFNEDHDTYLDLCALAALDPPEATYTQLAENRIVLVEGMRSIIAEYAKEGDLRAEPQYRPLAFHDMSVRRETEKLLFRLTGCYDFQVTSPKKSYVSFAMDVVSGEAEKSPSSKAFGKKLLSVYDDETEIMLAHYKEHLDERKKKPSPKHEQEQENEEAPKPPVVDQSKPCHNTALRSVLKGALNIGTIACGVALGIAISKRARP